VISNRSSGNLYPCWLYFWMLRRAVCRIDLSLQEITWCRFPHLPRFCENCEQPSRPLSSGHVHCSFAAERDLRDEFRSWPEQVALKRNVAGQVVERMGRDQPDMQRRSSNWVTYTSDNVSGGVFQGCTFSKWNVAWNKKDMATTS